MPGGLNPVMPRLPKLPAGSLFNASGRAGPRRIAAIILVGAIVILVVVGVIVTGRRTPPVSRDARMPPVNALPGGLNSSPEQDALARTANDAQATAALRSGASYTPPIAPSVPAVPPPPRVERADPQQTAVRRTIPMAPAPEHPVARAVVAQTVAKPVVAVLPAPVATASKPVAVAAVVDPKAGELYTRQIDAMVAQWGGRAPYTDVILPPVAPAGVDPTDPPPSGRPGAATAVHDAASATPAADRAADAGQILIPAGRGVFAHPVLALNSDASSPVVLQADSGPIAGDRMIGSFARQNERLIIHVATIIHNGESIGVDGVVTAPETMAAAVASNVDEHYAERFILPAAAAFVAGLGQALATTSNTTAVLSPLGGATTTTHLNIDQQLGVAAGVAAAQIAQTLNQSAPKGPTVTLDANVAVGVMFLANVTAHSLR